MEAEEVEPEVAIEQTCVRLSGTYVLTVKDGRMTWGDDSKKRKKYNQDAAVQSHINKTWRNPHQTLEKSHDDVCCDTVKQLLGICHKSNVPHSFIAGMIA